MKFEHLQGSIVAMVTPFRQDGSVNFDMLTELLERYRRHPDPGHHRRILHDEP